MENQIQLQLQLHNFCIINYNFNYNYVIGPSSVIGMFWQTRAYNGGNRIVLAGNGVQSAIPANVGNLWRAMAVLGGSPSSSATPAILVAANGGSEYNEY